MENWKEKSHLYNDRKSLPHNFHTCDSLDNKVIGIIKGTYHYDLLLYKADEVERKDKGYLVHQEEPTTYFCKYFESGKIYHRAIRDLELFIPDYLKSDVYCATDFPKIYNHNKAKIGGGLPPKKTYSKEEIMENDPETYEALERLIREESFDLDFLVEPLQELASSEGIDFRIKKRHKTIESAYSKIQRDPLVNIQNIHDINGIKFVTKKIEDCYKLLDLINSNVCDIDQFYDYIAVPKPNGFQCIMVRPEKKELRLDIHIQTELMMDRAENGSAADYRS
ncbi:MAG: hypothetical protein ACLFP2_05230 [Candidatus Woesearchaeota archaeon]